MQHEVIDLEKIYPYLMHDGIFITHDTLHPKLGGQMMKAVDEFAKDKSLERCTKNSSKTDSLIGGLFK